MVQKYVGIVILYILVLSSCMDDKGNYDYLEVDDVVIRYPLSVMFVNAGDSLVIDPRFDYKSKESYNHDDFTYEWKIGKEVVGVDRVLNIPSVELRIGEYAAMFSVISKETGIRYVQTFIIKVASKYSNGWLVLYDNGQGADLVYLKGSEIFDKGEDIWKPVWVYESEDSVYSKMNGAFLPVGCKKLVDHGYKPGDKEAKIGGVTVVCKGPDGGVELDGGSMIKDYTVRELFLENSLPVGFELKDIVYSGTGIYALGEDGRLYSGRYVDKVFWTSRLSDLTAKFKGEELRVDHFIPTEFYQSSFVWLMYSKEKKCFYSVYDDDSNIPDPDLGEDWEWIWDPEFWKSGIFMENQYFGGELPERCENFVMLDNMTMTVLASGYMNSGWGIPQSGYLLILKDPVTGEIYLQRHEDVLDRDLPTSVVEPRYNLLTPLRVSEDAIFLINAVSDQDVFLADDGVIYAFRPDFDKGFEMLVMDDTYRGKKITSMEFNNEASRLCVGFSDGTVIIYTKPNLGQMASPDFVPVEEFHKQYKGAILDIVFKNGAEVQGCFYTNEKPDMQ